MKVLHLTSGNLFGGIETYLLTLARLRYLVPEMEPQFGLCFPGRLRDELTASGVAVHDLGAVRVSRPWTVLRARRRLKAILREQRIDTVVTHGMWPHAVFGSTVKRAGIRLANAVHGEVSGRHWIDRWAARTRPDLVIANSRFTAASVATSFPGVPGESIHPPLAIPHAFDAAAARTRIRAEFELQPGTIAILMVSRIEELKGHAVLLDALSRMRDLADWCCWVVGGAQRPHEVELLSRLQTMASELQIGERVRFTGARSDIPALMSAADIYCQPNTGPEGFGLTFVEALRSGLAVVTSGFGGAVEIVDGTCGVLVPPGDSEALAAALRTLVADQARRRELGAAGPARAMALCDPARQMARLADLLSTGRKSGGPVG